MKLLDILKTVGTGLVSTHPLGALAITALNHILPDDKQLPESTTGLDALAAVEQMSSADRAKVEVAEFDYKTAIEEGQTRRYEAMTKADGQETRAKIVMISMWSLVVTNIIFIAAVAYVYATKGAATAFSHEMAFVYLTVTGTTAYVIRSYFGDLRQETHSRHACINGKQVKPTGIAGLISALKQS